MILEQGHIYHLYNQGNNRQKVFFTHVNYLYFLKKINEHILPFADVLAWCLMPNHFHLIIAVKVQNPSDRVTWSHPVTTPGHYKKELNNSIATMLSSYTRAINIQQKRSGSLFREGTKAVELGNIESERIKYQNRSAIGVGIAHTLDEEQLQTCFKYILQNPVEAGLVKQIIDWEFSSALDIAGIRKGSLINRKLIEELGLLLGK